MDETLEICRKYGIRTIYVPPGNMYSAINSALISCESPWLGYLNSDDIVYPASYGRLIRFGEIKETDVVYGSCDFVDDEGRYLHSFLPGRPSELNSHFRSFQFSFTQPAAIFRKMVFVELNGFDEKYNLTSDFDFYFRSIIHGHQFAMLEGKSVSCFRISATQFSQRTQKMKEQTNQVCQKFGKPTLKDYLITGAWKFRNWQNYLIRLLRYQVLNGKYRFVRTTDVSSDEKLMSPKK